MTRDPRVTKVAAGNYRVGQHFSVYRYKGQWYMGSAHRSTEIYATYRLAVLAALIVAGLATDAECDAFRAAS
jgi:hypothetical protein